jgi:hypothetical protein
VADPTSAVAGRPAQGWRGEPRAGRRCPTRVQASGRSIGWNPRGARPERRRRRELINRAVGAVWAVFRSRRVLSLVLLGFASGLPYLLTQSTLAAWMTDAGVSLETIGLFSLVTLPYTLRLGWSPLPRPLHAPAPGSAMRQPLPSKSCCPRMSSSVLRRQVLLASRQTRLEACRGTTLFAYLPLEALRRACAPHQRGAWARRRDGRLRPKSDHPIARSAVFPQPVVRRRNRQRRNE